MNLHLKKILLLFMALSHFSCAMLLKTPQDKTPENFNRITIETNDKVQLQVNHYAKGNRAVVVIAHGFMQNKDTKTFRKIAESFSPEFDVISIDFRGHGKSKGRFYLTAKETGDLITVLNYARARYERIGVMGFSLGAAISILVGGQTELIDSLVAVSGPEAYDKIDFQFWRKEALNQMVDNMPLNKSGKGVRLGNPFLNKPRPIDYISKYKRPVLFIHGTNDWLIRSYHSEDLFAAANEPKEIKVVEKGLHAEKIFEQFPVEFSIWTKAWFQKTLYPETVAMQVNNGKGASR